MVGIGCAGRLNLAIRDQWAIPGHPFSALTLRLAPNGCSTQGEACGLDRLRPGNGVDWPQLWLRQGVQAGLG
jgi:hypothetical protein